MCSACSGDYEDPDMTNEPEPDEPKRTCPTCPREVPAYFLPGMVCAMCLSYGQWVRRMAKAAP